MLRNLIIYLCSFWASSLAAAPGTTATPRSRELVSTPIQNETALASGPDETPNAKADKDVIPGHQDRAIHVIRSEGKSEQIVTRP